jgi:hypothetical protein
VAAPDYPAAAGWWRRAADAGCEQSAKALSRMYLLGNGWVSQIMAATVCFFHMYVARFLSFWHPLTSGASLARPSGAALRAANGGRCNGAARPPRMETPHRA